MLTRFPNGLDEIKKTYGDPTEFRLPDGYVSPMWERMLGMLRLPAPLPLGWDRSVHVRRMRIHYLLLPSLGRVLDRINLDGNWQLLQTFDGTYTWRASRTSAKLSTHCWGIAIDLNASTNQLGTKGDMPVQIIQAFGEEGWEWGGDWSYPDPMHFQACYGY
jgi:hypothetical protein